MTRIFSHEDDCGKLKPGARCMGLDRIGGELPADKSVGGKEGRRGNSADDNAGCLDCFSLVCFTSSQAIRRDLLTPT
jgi:hypothetical protein